MHLRSMQPNGTACAFRTEGCTSGSIRRLVRCACFQAHTLKLTNKTDNSRIVTNIHNTPYICLHCFFHYMAPKCTRQSFDYANIFGGVCLGLILPGILVLVLIGMWRYVQHVVTFKYFVNAEFSDEYAICESSEVPVFCHRFSNLSIMKSRTLSVP